MLRNQMKAIQPGASTLMVSIDGVAKNQTAVARAMKQTFQGRK
jgi:hypothetical protein